MHRLLPYLFISLFFATPCWAQDEAAGPGESEVAQNEAEAEAEAEPDVAEAEDEVIIDETGLDEQGFTGEDNDFRPSEDIPADQSIAFPTDI